MALFWIWQTPVLFLMEKTVTVAHFRTSHCIYMSMFLLFNLYYYDIQWFSVFSSLEGSDNFNQKKSISKLHQEKAIFVLWKDRENFSCLPRKTKEKALLKSKSLPNFSSLQCKCDHKFYSKAFIVCVFNFPFVWHTKLSLFGIWFQFTSFYILGVDFFCFPQW